jgi:hypothetical protein
MSLISWGVDKFGVKSYFCNYCELVFGEVDPDSIKHDCDTTKARYHNRDIFQSDIDRDNHHKLHAKKNKDALSDIEIHSFN